jgi:hypothetical protein
MTCPHFLVNAILAGCPTNALQNSPEIPSKLAVTSITDLERPFQSSTVHFIFVSIEAGMQERAKRRVHG